jgi:hypothetical protein
MHLSCPAETLRAENDNGLLTVTVTHSTAEVLNLHYQFYNRSALPIYLLNQLWDTIGTHSTTGQSIFRVSPKLANIEVGTDNVKVSKAVVDVPYGTLVELWHLPCLARVAPSGRYEEMVELPYPLRPYTPYEPEVELGEVVSRKLHFGLGYIVGEADIESTLCPVATAAGSSFYLHGLLAKDQLLLTTGPFEAPVLVNSLLHPRAPKPASTGKWTPWG